MIFWPSVCLLFFKSARVVVDLNLLGALFRLLYILILDLTKNKPWQYYFLSAQRRLARCLRLMGVPLIRAG